MQKMQKAYWFNYKTDFSLIYSFHKQFVNVFCISLSLNIEYLLFCKNGLQIGPSVSMVVYAPQTK